MAAHACNPSYSGGWGRRIGWTREVEFAVSQDHATALQHNDRVRLEREREGKKENVNLELGGSDIHKWVSWIHEFNSLIHSTI